MKVSVNINGQTLEVPAGINGIEACKLAGVEVPHFCYHKELSLAGSCRMCLVSVGTPARDRATGAPVLNDDGTAQIAFMPKPAIACGTTVSEGMHIRTNTPEIVTARQGVMEFILANHPLDCPICDKAGECRLQEFAANFGNGESRFVEDKNVKAKRVKIGGGKIVLDAERCVLCSRCIRYCKEKIGREIFGFTKRGSKTEISVYDPEDDGGDYLVNVADICPVGALTEAAFRFKMRTWFLRATDSISAESSAGVNTRVWSREGKIYRITPRENPQVNESWMPDSARLEYRDLDDGNRLSTMRVDGAPCANSYAIARAVESLGREGLAIVASPFRSLEEQFLIAELVKLSGAKVYAVSHLGEDDGRLVSADRSPNMRGLFAAGLLEEYPQGDLAELAKFVRVGEIKNILCFDEDLLSLGLEEKDFKLANVVFCGVDDNETARHAKVAIALESDYEKRGLFINRQWRLQEFKKALQAPAGIANSVEMLIQFINSLGNTGYTLHDTNAVRAAMCKRSDILPPNCETDCCGVLLDASKFAAVNFPEKDGLNFKKNG